MPSTKAPFLTCKTHGVICANKNVSKLMIAAFKTSRNKCTNSNNQFLTNPKLSPNIANSLNSKFSKNISNKQKGCKNKLNNNLLN